MTKNQKKMGLTGHIKDQKGRLTPRQQRRIFKNWIRTLDSAPERD